MSPRESAARRATAKRVPKEPAAPKGRSRSLSVRVQQHVLHESGFKCANPACRTILTLDVHHIVHFSAGGSNDPENLVPLCGNCHGLHHLGKIPVESIRTWKMLLLSLNEAYDRRSVDVLLGLASFAGRSARSLYTSGDGVLQCAALLAGGLVEVTQRSTPAEMMRTWPSENMPVYSVKLSKRGRLFVDAWKSGNQEAAVANLGDR